MSLPLAGAVMTTFLAPAWMCLPAPGPSRKTPVPSMTRSASISRRLRGSRSDTTKEVLAADGDGGVIDNLHVGVEGAEDGVVLEEVSRGLAPPDWLTRWTTSRGCRAPRTSSSGRSCGLRVGWWRRGAIDASAEVSGGTGGVRRTRGGVGDGAQHSTRCAARAREARAGWWPARRRRDAPIPVGRCRDRYYYRARAAASVSRCLRGSIGWRGSGDAPMRPKPLMATFTLASVTVLTAAALSKEGRGGSTGQPGARGGEIESRLRYRDRGVHVILTHLDGLAALETEVPCSRNAT